MSANKNMRTLALAKILQERTDEDHPLSTSQLIEILQNEYGIGSHRVTIYEDIEQLRSFGFDIYTVKSRQNKYYMATRVFDLPELKLLIDAVESSKFITEKKSRVLTEKLTALASKNGNQYRQKSPLPLFRVYSRKAEETEERRGAVYPKPIHAYMER